MQLHTATRCATVAAALILTFNLGCGREQPAEEGLVEDLSNLMPAEPAVPDSAAAAPEHTEIVHADQYVAVTRVALAPGEAVPPHPGGDRLLYAITAGTLSIEDGAENLTFELEPGLVVALQPGDYGFSNTGGTEVEGLIVARTNVPLPEVADMARSEPAPAGRILYSSDLARVRELDLEPSVGFELAPVPIRVVYAPGTVVLEYMSDEGEPSLVETAGMGVHVRSTGDHSVVNRAADPATVVLFELFQ